MDKEIQVRIKALVEGLNSVKDLQSTLKAIQSQGNKKFDITGGGTQQGNTRKVIALFRELSGTSDGLSNRLDGVTKAAGVADGALGTVAIGATALLGAVLGAGVGVFKLAQRAAEAGANLTDLSDKSGISVEDLSGFRLATEKSGTSIEQFNDFLIKFQINLSEAAKGNKELREEFKRLGVDIDGEPRKALEQFFAGLSKIPDEAERLEVAAKVGGRGAKELGGAFKEIGPDLDAFIAKARELGFVIDKETAEAADEFDDTLSVLKVMVAGAVQQLGGELLPEVTRVMQGVQGELQDNQSAFKQWGTGIADTIRGLRLAVESDIGGILGYIARLTAETSAGPLLGILDRLKIVGKSQREDNTPASPIFGAGRIFDKVNLLGFPGNGIPVPTAAPKGNTNTRTTAALPGGKGGGGGGSSNSDAEQKALQERLKLLNLELRGVEANFRAEEEAAKRAYDQRRISLQEFAEQSVGTENLRYERQREIILKEIEDVAAHDKDREFKVKELNQKLLEAEQAHNSKLNRIQDDAREEGEARSRAFAEGLLRIQQTLDERKVASIRFALQQEAALAEQKNRDLEFQYQHGLLTLDNFASRSLAVERARYEAEEAALKKLEEIERASIRRRQKDAEARLEQARKGSAEEGRIKNELALLEVELGNVVEEQARRREEARERERDREREILEERQREQERVDREAREKFERDLQTLAENISGIVQAGFEEGWDGALESFTQLLEQLADKLLTSLFFALLTRLFGLDTGNSLGTDILGPVLGFAEGGFVAGPGTPTSDSIPALLSDGEYVVRAAAVQRLGVGMLDRLNAIGAPRFADGGFVSAQLGDLDLSGGSTSKTFQQINQFTIQTKDVQSFRASQRSIERDIGRAAAKGLRSSGE
ncbi:MAG: hypothetical protein QOG00_269 [Pyrinomonadaceae bacterium]|nr:hypothetical protein [Pyrinomonadaceae bacterium]